MRRNFWIGLFIGCISSLLGLALAGVVVAAAERGKSSVAALEAQPTASADNLQTSPQGGGGPGPVTSVFSYQGLLKKNGTPVNGSCDLRFKLFDASAAYGGSQYGATLDAPNTTVTNGVFTAYLDFGNEFNGQARFLETSVSCPSSPSPIFTTLPRQLLTGTPYALSLRPGATISSTTTTPVLDIEGNSAGAALLAENLVDNTSAQAIYGNVWTGHAVTGYSLAPTGYGFGVIGVSNSISGTGVFAQAYYTGAALRIGGGNIRVDNAGIGTNTPVFIHQVKTGTTGNLCSIQNYASVINNIQINGNPNAILVVTPNYGPNNTGTAPAVGIPAVYYDATDQCGKGAGRWVIYNLNSMALTNNSLYNVMAVVP